MVEVDSIYAELNACGGARKFYERCCTISELEGHDFDDRIEKAFGALVDAFRKLLETLPTTEAGLLAKLAFVRKFHEDYPDAVLDDMDILPGLVIAA
jgi:hypothetical protein